MALLSKRTGRISLAAIFFLFAAAGGAVWFFFEPLKDSLALKIAARASGLRAEARTITLESGRTGIRFEGLRFYNPEGYPDEVMLDIPLLYLELHGRELLKGRVHAKRMVLDIQTLHIYKNAKGEINLSVLQSGEKNGLRVDRLHVSLQEIYYRDYTFADEPLVQHLPVLISRDYADIKGLGVLKGIVGYEALRNTAVSRLVPLNPGKFLQSNVFDPITVANKYVTGTVSSVEDTVVGAAGAVAGGIKGAAGKVGSALFPGRGESAAEDKKNGGEKTTHLSDQRGG